jgi:nucleotide-binding universal stress UspA family protein
MKRIVVGIDGSPASLDALRWAVEEARARHVPIRAVSAWSYPVYAYSGYIAVPPDAAYEEAARTAMQESMTLAQSHVDLDDVELSGELVKGSPAEVLIEASRDADLLVVGPRGRGGFTGLLLGSVSRAVTAHAHCPVVVVHLAPAVATSLNGDDRCSPSR